MKKQDMIHNALEMAARKAIPDNVNLLPNISAKVGNGERTSRLAPVRKLSTAVIIAVIALVVLASAAYAAYRLFWDPGLQGVKDAGLGSVVNPMPQSTLLPEVTLISAEKVPVVLVGETQTINGVTMTLDWVSLNSSRLMLGFTASGLSNGVSIGNPEVAFSGTTPKLLTGSSLILSGTDPIIGEYVSYEVVNDVPQDGKVSLALDIPVAKGNEIAASFHFDVGEVGVNSNQPASGQQTYTVSVNGIGVTLEWLQMTDKSTTALLCYDQPTVDGNWQLSLLTVQYDDGSYNSRGDPILAQTLNPADSRGNQKCARAEFPIGRGSDSRMLQLSIAELSNGEDRRKGVWDFVTILPEAMTVQNTQTTPTQLALDIKSVGDLTATLEWAYADTHRVALLLHFTGWGEGYGIGDLKATDDSGKEINNGMGYGSPEGDPATYQITLYFDEYFLANKSELVFHLDVPVWAPQVSDKPLASFRFDLDLPLYQARVTQPGQRIIANGLEMKLVKVSITPSYTDLTLCYQKPTHTMQSDWMIGSEAILEIIRNTSKMDIYRLLSDADYGGYAGKGTPPPDLPYMESGRCVQVGFPVGDLAKPGPTSLKLTIPSLELSMPEVIPNDQLIYAIDKLKAQGIDVSVTSSSGNGGGGGGWSVISKPEGMTDEEAYQKFKEALGYVYPGPWVMEILVP